MDDQKAFLAQMEEATSRQLTLMKKAGIARSGRRASSDPSAPPSEPSFSGRPPPDEPESPSLFGTAPRTEMEHAFEEGLKDLLKGFLK